MKERPDASSKLNESTARKLLLDIVDDILDVQIGTQMFWPSEETLRADGFAQYVHHSLLEASKAMQWTHYDSSKVWDDEPPEADWPVLLRYNPVLKVWTAEALELPQCVGSAGTRFEAIDDVAAQIRSRHRLHLPAPWPVELVFVKDGQAP